jgi:RNA polymerase sigma factor (sigma-70 family)
MNEHCTDQLILDGLAMPPDHPEFERAVRCLYERCYPQILRWVLDNSGTTEDAEDLFQEVMAILIDAAHKGKLNLHHTPCAWLFQVARFQWMHVLRRSKIWNRIKGSLDDLFGLPEKPADEQLSEDEAVAIRTLLFQQSFSKLGRRCQGILQDFYLEEKKMTEIAERHQLKNEHNARQEKLRCMKRLKKMIFKK